MSTSSSPVAGSALSLSPKSAGGVTDPQQTNEVIGPNDSVASFTKVLSELALGEQGGISNGKPPLEAKHPSDRGGRNKNHLSKAADLKRETFEPLVGVSPTPVQEVSHKGNVLGADKASNGNGDVPGASRAQASMGTASSAQTGAKPAASFVTSQWAGPSSMGSLTGEVSGTAIAETNQRGDSPVVRAVQASKTPPFSPSVEPSKPSVIASAPETSKASAVQKMSDQSQMEAVLTDSGTAAIAKTSALESPFAPWYGSAPKEMQISGNPFPVSRESLPTRAGAMDRSVSGGLVNSTSMPAESARPATSDRTSRSFMASSAATANAHLNFLQVQKADSSMAVVPSNTSGNLSASIDVKALSEAISRPLVNGNGSHTIVVAMHPAELGQLEAVVSMDRTALQVSLAPQTQAGHLALAQAVDALKSQLAQSGMNVNVTLRDPGSQSGNEPRQYRNEPRQASEVPDDGTRSRSAVSPLTAGQIHLVL